VGICKLDAEGPAPPSSLFLVPHLTSEVQSSGADSQIVQHGCSSCRPQGQRGQNLVAGAVTLGPDTKHWPLVPLSPRTVPHPLSCPADALVAPSTLPIDSTLDFNTTESWWVHNSCDPLQRSLTSYGAGEWYVTQSQWDRAFRAATPTR
jgi:hypothetical protein